MSSYYTETAFEIPEVRADAVKWLRALFNVLNAIACGDSPDDMQEEYRVLLPRFGEAGWEEGTSIEFDGYTMCIFGEIRVDALNEALKCFLERWYPDRTIEYSWSRRSDWEKEVGEFYGDKEIVSLKKAAEDSTSLVTALRELEAVFAEEFGRLCLSMTARSGVQYAYLDGVVAVSGTNMCRCPLDGLVHLHAEQAAKDLPELWQALEQKRAETQAEDARALVEVRNVLAALRAKRTPR